MLFGTNYCIQHLKEDINIESKKSTFYFTIVYNVISQFY